MQAWITLMDQVAHNIEADMFHDKKPRRKGRLRKFIAKILAAVASKLDPEPVVKTVR